MFQIKIPVDVDSCLASINQVSQNATLSASFSCGIKDLTQIKFNQVIQSQWSVHVAIISMVSFASIYWLFSKYRLNWPLIFTVGLDTTCVWSFFFYVMRNYAGSRFNAFTAAIIILTLIWSLLVREAFYFAVMPHNIIGDVKRSGFPLSRDNMSDMIKYSILVPVLAYLLTYYKVLHCEWDGLFTTVGMISFEYWVLSISKDMTSMNILHKMMHNNGNKWLKECHERHHRVKAELTYFHVFLVDLIDIGIESFSGIIFLAAANYFILTGKASFHVFVLFFSLLTDLSIHSGHPYTWSVFNPFLDYFMKPNLTHNLHHMLLYGYYTMYPWYHLYDPARRQHDIDTYNKHLKNLHISHDIFLKIEVGTKSVI